MDRWKVLIRKKGRNVISSAESEVRLVYMPRFMYETTLQRAN